jgi:hypothetical protein
MAAKLKYRIISEWGKRPSIDLLNDRNELEATIYCYRQDDGRWHLITIGRHFATLEEGGEYLVKAWGREQEIDYSAADYAAGYAYACGYYD